MSGNDFESFSLIMVAMAENYGTTITKEGVRMRFAVLKEYSIEEIKASAFSIMRMRKYTTMPTIADFIDHLGGNSVENIAEIEADKVVSAIRDFGPYQSVVFDNPTTQAVIVNTFGGWSKICELKADEAKWFRKDFSKAYKAYSAQGLKHFGHLCGICEIQNNSKGIEWDTQVLIVGDKKLARKVLECGKGKSAGSIGIGRIKEICEVKRVGTASTVPA